MNLQRSFFSFVILLLACAAASAQQSASSGIIGQVTDASKSSVPGATVTVINVGTNAQRSATTDSEGRFSVPNLPPATYEIKVELSGFRTVDLKDFELRQGEIARRSRRRSPRNRLKSCRSRGETCCRWRPLPPG